MKNKVLIVTTTPYMIRQFLMNDISILQSFGYEVEVATNFASFNVIDDNSLSQFKNILQIKNVVINQIDFPRNIKNFTGMRVSYKQIKKLLKKNYKILHTHTPIASAIVRFAARNKLNTKMIYTAHGFHFYKGAPLKNWLLFYPIEKWLSKYTDILITINKEDFHISNSKFKANQNIYIPGIGVNTNEISKIQEKNIRDELNISQKNKILLSIGELSERKNHSLVIKALEGLPDITYIICGQGDLREYLLELAREKKVDLKLLGFRNDRIEIIKSVNIFVFPSLQEGLPVALMEAMACNTLCIVSDIRGNVDLISSEEYKFDSKDVNDCREKIIKALELEQNEYQYDMLNFSLDNIEKIMRNIYGNIEF